MVPRLVESVRAKALQSGSEMVELTLEVDPQVLGKGLWLGNSDHPSVEIVEGLADSMLVKTPERAAASVAQLSVCGCA